MRLILFKDNVNSYFLNLSFIQQYLLRAYYVVGTIIGD